MMNDPIIDEIRVYRQEHTDRFDGDLHRICEDLRARQKTCGHKVVSFGTKHVDKPKNTQHARET